MRLGVAVNSCSSSVTCYECKFQISNKYEAITGCRGIPPEAIRRKWNRMLIGEKKIEADCEAAGKKIDEECPSNYDDPLLMEDEAAKAGSSDQQLTIYNGRKLASLGLRVCPVRVLK